MANTLRDYALQQGLKIDYDPNKKTVGIGGKQYTPQQLSGMGGSLVNGSWSFQDAAQLRAFNPENFIGIPIGSSPQPSRGVIKPYEPPTTQSMQSGQPQTDGGSLIKYKDQAGNIHELDPMYERTGQLPSGWTRQQAIQPTLQPQSTTGSPVPNVKTVEQLMRELTMAQQSQKANALNQAFDATRGRLAAEQQALAPQYAQQQRAISAQDTMARANSQNQLAMQGLAGSGAANQQATSQNVISQGAMSNLGMQRAAAESDIQRRLSEAQRVRDYGIADANDAASLMGLEQQLNRLSQQEGYARQDAQLAIQTGQREQEVARQRELDTLGQYSNDYQAEINRRQATPDTSDDWLIPYLTEARMGKIGDTTDAKFKSDLENIGQYYNDYQAEINRRMAANPNDPLIPYLKTARQQKIAAMEAEEQKRAIQAEKDRIAAEELRIKQQNANKPKSPTTPKPVSQPIW